MVNLVLDVWSDIACPWCYVGKRRLEAALARFPHREEVEVRWRAFELDPRAPREKDPAVSYAERLARKYATPLARAEDMIRTMTQAAAAEGLAFDFERIRPGNTFDAHRLIHHAAGRGLADAVKERFLRGYLCEGEPIGDPDSLVRLAVEAGLDEADARAVLDGDAHADAVRADEDEARARGIQGVPCFVFGDLGGLSGAQPPELLLHALNEVRRRLEVPIAASGAGEACGPEGCG